MFYFVLVLLCSGSGCDRHTDTKQSETRFEELLNASAGHVFIFSHNIMFFSLKINTKSNHMVTTFNSVFKGEKKSI